MFAYLEDPGEEESENNKEYVLLKEERRGFLTPLLLPLFLLGDSSDTKLFFHGSARHPSKRPKASDC